MQAGEKPFPSLHCSTTLTHHPLWCSVSCTCPFDAEGSRTLWSIQLLAFKSLSTNWSTQGKQFYLCVMFPFQGWSFRESCVAMNVIANRCDCVGDSPELRRVDRAAERSPGHILWSDRVRRRLRSITCYKQSTYARAREKRKKEIKLGSTRETTTTK